MTDESIDLSHLSPDEYRKIIDVIKRDQDLKKQEEQRILWVSKTFAAFMHILIFLAIHNKLQ